MISYLQNSEIDKVAWDACIGRSANGLMYAYSWYLDALCPGEWDALVEEDYRTVFPLPRRKKAGIIYIYTPFFIQQLGAFSDEAVNDDKVNAFLRAVPEHFKLIELNLNTWNKASDKAYSYTNNLNHQLSLGRSYEEIQSNYSANLKRNLQKAGKNIFSIARNFDVDPVIALFRKEKGREIKHWKEREYLMFSELMSECRMRGHLDVWNSYAENGELLAGIVFVRSTSRAIFLFSASSLKAKETAAMPHLIDSFIKENSRTQLVLDFEGSNDQGLARFYAGFGAQQMVYQRAEKNKLPAWLNLIRKAFR